MFPRRPKGCQTSSLEQAEVDGHGGLLKRCSRSSVSPYRHPLPPCSSARWQPRCTAPGRTALLSCSCPRWFLSPRCRWTSRQRHNIWTGQPLLLSFLEREEECSVTLACEAFSGQALESPQTGFQSFKDSRKSSAPLGETMTEVVEHG